MKIESFAILLFAAWFMSEGLLLRTAKDRSGSNVDRRSMLLLVTSNLVALFLSIALYFLAIGTAAFPPMLKLIGVALMFTGITIRFAGMWMLKKFFSANVAVQSDHRLVIKGPYRVVRHPGYFGGWLMFVGFGLALGNVIALLWLAVFTLPAFLYRIDVEEDILRRAFPEYVEYAARVKRFVPFVW
ncbi:methyltransferase family protein [Dyella sp. Tek66A03]|uniref:methyltransferase family protein n=1 Tax=Dyella sp. Tek66A03 TaxID=3458298 RepID=UPI00403E37A9